eukprot:Seg720.3 transcript_id=Seg720.3/GoldUCD/mRNA.D3Y31 product="hypothetical protein" pseudo=true protein_id=Seg720.3/GoldUCD/D3Y31
MQLRKDLHNVFSFRVLHCMRLLQNACDEQVSLRGALHLFILYPETRVVLSALYKGNMLIAVIWKQSRILKKNVLSI